MPEHGILCDHAGNLELIPIEEESFMSELYEHVGCKVAKATTIQDGLNLWTDAEGAANGQRLNQELTNLVRKIGIITDPIYGPGLFIGCIGTGETAPITSISNTQRLVIVLGHIAPITSVSNTQ